jgi:hypothetical protein
LFLDAKSELQNSVSLIAAILFLIKRSPAWLSLKNLANPLHALQMKKETNKSFSGRDWMHLRPVVGTIDLCLSLRPIHVETAA